MSFGAYLLGALGSLAGLGTVLVTAIVLRSRLIPGWSGPVAWVAIAVLAAAVAIVPALVLGTVGLLTGWSWLLVTGLTALATRRWQERLPVASARPALVSVPASAGLTVVGLSVTAVSFGAFVADTSIRFGTGMTGFDSTWYHGPLAAGIAQSGDTFSLSHLAPQFLSWFYPQNSEIFHALGMSAFGTDLLSILINLVWFVGCLLAAWCIGRPYGAAPLSMAGVALAIGSAAMADQAGEARNDIVGTFFVLAAVAVMINAAAGRRRITLGPALVVALAAGLAAGTKVNFIPAALVLMVGLIVVAGSARRLRTGLICTATALVGGGYWYLRNLVLSGNPLPWIDHLGPLSLPGPNQDVGGRDAGSVWGYLTNLDVIRDWFLPGFSDGFGAGWILVVILALAGLGFCLGRGSGPARRTGAAVGIALVLAWLLAPTSASGPPGEPNGFVSGLRYLAPALAVCLALLGSGIGPRGSQARWLAMATVLLLAPFTLSLGQDWDFRNWGVAVVFAGAFWLVCLVGLGIWGVGARFQRESVGSNRGWLILPAGLLVVFVILCGQGVQRYYFDHRYLNPEFTTAELASAFAWAQDVQDSSIGTTITRQYPLWGKELSNRVEFIGLERPNGGFVAADSCEQFVAAVNGGGYDYLVIALDREHKNRVRPREWGWIAGDPNLAGMDVGNGHTVFSLNEPLSPSTCGR